MDSASGQKSRGPPRLRGQETAVKRPTEEINLTLNIPLHVNKEMILLWLTGEYLLKKTPVPLFRHHRFLHIFMALTAIHQNLEQCLE